MTHLFFDLDGTLNDPYEGITSCIKYALESVGIDENDPQKLRSYIGPPLRNTFALYGFDEKKCEELVKKYREKFLVTGIHQNIPYEGSREMLESLHEHGCKIALASCKPERACRIILEETGVLKYFDEVESEGFFAFQTQQTPNPGTENGWTKWPDDLDEMIRPFIPQIVSDIAANPRWLEKVNIIVGDFMTKDYMKTNEILSLNLLKGIVKDELKEEFAKAIGKS